MAVFNLENVKLSFLQRKVLHKAILGLVILGLKGQFKTVIFRFAVFCSLGEFVVNFDNHTVTKTLSAEPTLSVTPTLLAGAVSAYKKATTVFAGAILCYRFQKETVFARITLCLIGAGQAAWCACFAALVVHEETI